MSSTLALTNNLDDTRYDYLRSGSISLDLLPPFGIPNVINNGALALKDGKVLDDNAGQPIRFPVESKGCFVPVEADKWLDDHAIKTPGVQGIDDTGSSAVI